ncbi:GNAT family N-acetyltransferase [Catenulispora subtropica]|uniref:GNAT family N-acetyltransferase n=1 Tax=Catenulispora subtropica TaxID=450798 RepID=A0ABN2T1L4_9ACTN
MTIEIKVVTDSALDDFSDAIDVGFYHPENRGVRGAARREWFAEDLAAGRFIGAYDGGRTVGTFSNMLNRVTVPGGASVPVGAVTTVTVTQTHRRRGILTSMMAAGLRQSADAGEPLSILIPAEWPIYGRYGYGHATDEARYTFEAGRCAAVRPLPGTVEFVPGSQYVEELSAVYDRVQAATPGSIERRNKWFERDAGILTWDGKPTDKEYFFALYRDESGMVRGGVRYKFSDGGWEGFVPDGEGTDVDLVAENHVARVRLLQFLWEQDWITSFTIEHSPVDDSWRHLMANPRYARQKQRYDVLWARVLDVPAALEARTYENEGRLVVAVTDPAGYAEGVYALEGGPGGASVKRTTASADLTMPVQTLGALYFGNHAATALAGVGGLTEDKPGALAVADRMFKTAIPPFCATWF